MKCYRCPDVCSGHLSGVCLLIFTWVSKNLVCPYHIHSHKTRFHQIWKKNIFWAGKNVSQKWRCFLHFEEHAALNIRFWECRMCSDFCFRHFSCKNIFPVAKVCMKRSFFRPFSCIYPLRSLWPKLKIEILHSFFKYNSR